MARLEVLATDESPYVLFDHQEGLMLLEGKSLPENIMEFYDPLEREVLEYIKKPLPETTLKINLYYLNSSSTKRLLEIICHFEQIAKQGFNVNLFWYCHENDEDMMEEGAEFARLTDLPVEIIVVSD